MKRSFHLTLRATLAVALFSIAFSAASARAQVDFTRYVALGDSLTAGFQSGSLNQTYQATSYPALIARQGGATGFQQPLVTEPGIPAILELRSLSPLQIVPKAGIGQPANLTLPRPYNNMAVPGADVVDLTTTTTDSGGLHDLILRRTGFTQLQQGLSLAPTVVTLWIGNNDVLGAAIRGRAIEGVTLTPKAAFRQAYGAIVANLRTSGARIVAATLPDVTGVPFVTTIAPYLVDPITRQPVVINGQRVPLLGPGGPLASSTFVTLAASSFLAQGIGIPTAAGGKGTPLPDEVLLDAGEVAIIQDYVDANNQAIREICGAASIPVVDVNAIFREIKISGRRIGGVTVTPDFLTGGLFGYDGVHATDLGYAILANEWIAVINANGGSLPEVDLLPYLGVNTGRPARFEPAAQAVFSQEAWDQLLAVFPTVDGR